MEIKQNLINLYEKRINDFKEIVEKFPNADLAGIIPLQNQTIV